MYGTKELPHKYGLENIKSHVLVTGVFYNGITSDSYKEIVSITGLNENVINKSLFLSPR